MDKKPVEGDTTDDNQAGWDVTPKTEKGRRSKEALLVAARKVFRENGFSAARVSDMAAEAGMSNGAFYRYFRDKHDVLIALLHQLQTEMYEFARAPWEPGDPKRSVYLTTTRYLELYHAHADLMQVEIESAQTEQEVLELWQEARQMFYRRIARSLRRGQTEGSVRMNVNPDLAASLLGGMTEHYAYLAFVLDEEPEQRPEEVSEQLAEIWAFGVFEPDTSKHAPR